MNIRLPHWVAVKGISSWLPVAGLLAAGAWGGAPLSVTAGNPLINNVHSADPSAHVWPGDDRLWIYASHDQPGANNHDTMISYHVFSTTNLVDWTDYGVVLHQKDVKWAASHMWAIDCVLWKGLYYLVFCAADKETGMFRTGLATSSRPQGPFTDIGYIQGVEWGQDPALFVDDDGKPYLYWGSGGTCMAAQLTDDLRSIIPGSKTNLTAQLKWVFEGPWVHKYQGKYYLSYPGLLNNQWPERMYYATADHPLGPYTFRGEYIGKFPGQAGTNHGSIARYRNRWYAFHHSMWISGNKSECRNLMADYLNYNDDGTIQPIIPTREGVVAGDTRPAPSRVTILLEAENGEAACGNLFQGVTVATNRPGYSGAGYVTQFAKPYATVTVMVQAAKPASYRLKIRYAAPDRDQQNKVFVNYTALDDPRATDLNRYNKQIRFPKTTEFTELDAGLITLKEGDNYIRLVKATGGVDVDYFKLEPVAP